MKAYNGPPSSLLQPPSTSGPQLPLRGSMAHPNAHSTPLGTALGDGLLDPARCMQQRADHLLPTRPALKGISAPPQGQGAVKDHGLLEGMLPKPHP